VNHQRSAKARVFQQTARAGMTCIMKDPWSMRIGPLEDA
jgi:hypothetical protein